MHTGRSAWSEMPGRQRNPKTRHIPAKNRSLTGRKRRLVSNDADTSPGPGPGTTSRSNTSPSAGSSDKADKAGNGVTNGNGNAAAGSGAAAAAAAALYDGTRNDDRLVARIARDSRPAKMRRLYSWNASVRRERAVAEITKAREAPASVKAECSADGARGAAQACTYAEYALRYGAHASSSRVGPPAMSACTPQSPSYVPDSADDDDDQNKASYTPNAPTYEPDPPADHQDITQEGKAKVAAAATVGQGQASLMTDSEDDEEQPAAEAGAGPDRGQSRMPSRVMSGVLGGGAASRLASPRMSHLAFSRALSSSKSSSALAFGRALSSDEASDLAFSRALTLAESSSALACGRAISSAEASLLSSAEGSASELAVATDVAEASWEENRPVLHDALFGLMVRVARAACCPLSSNCMEWANYASIKAEMKTWLERAELDGGGLNLSLPLIFTKVKLVTEAVTLYPYPSSTHGSWSQFVEALEPFDPADPVFDNHPGIGRRTSASDTQGLELVWSVPHLLKLLAKTAPRIAVAGADLADQDSSLALSLLADWHARMAAILAHRQQLTSLFPPMPAKTKDKSAACLVPAGATPAADTAPSADGGGLSTDSSAPDALRSGEAKQSGAAKHSDAGAGVGARVWQTEYATFNSTRMLAEQQLHASAAAMRGWAGAQEQRISVGCNSNRLAATAGILEAATTAPALHASCDVSMEAGVVGQARAMVGQANVSGQANGSDVVVGLAREVLMATLQVRELVALVGEFLTRDLPSASVYQEGALVHDLRLASSELRLALRELPNCVREVTVCDLASRYGGRGDQMISRLFDAIYGEPNALALRALVQPSRPDNYRLRLVLQYAWSDLNADNDADGDDDGREIGWPPRDFPRTDNATTLPSSVVKLPLPSSVVKPLPSSVVNRKDKADKPCSAVSFRARAGSAATDSLGSKALRTIPLTPLMLTECRDEWLLVFARQWEIPACLRAMRGLDEFGRALKRFLRGRAMEFQLSNWIGTVLPIESGILVALKEEIRNAFIPSNFFGDGVDKDGTKTWTRPLHQWAHYDHLLDAIVAVTAAEQIFQSLATN